MVNKLNQLSDSGRFLLSLINDTLDMNKIDSKQMKLIKSNVNLYDVVNNLISFSSVQIKDKNQDFVLENNIQRDVYAVGDRVRIQQILLNILSNAVKFTQENGKIRLKAEIIANDNNRINLKVMIEDNGFGMSEEFLPHIFDVFSQERREITSYYVGSGLGMSIVKSLVDMMDGHIEVRSQLTKGTTVIVEIPLEAAGADNKKE